jgi:hypothetical protein
LSPITAKKGPTFTDELGRAPDRGSGTSSTFRNYNQ